MKVIFFLAVFLSGGVVWGQVPDGSITNTTYASPCKSCPGPGVCAADSKNGVVDPNANSIGLPPTGLAI